MKTAALILFVYVVISRLVELYISRQNTRRLVEAGGREYFSEHYPYMIAMHVTWLVLIAGLFWHDYASIEISSFFFALYLVFQVLRVWVLTTLGRYFTTKIVSVDNVPLINHGPYRFIRHPNYAVVIGEIFCLPMVFGFWHVALIFSALNFVVLFVRISKENQVLQSRVAL